VREHRFRRLRAYEVIQLGHPFPRDACTLHSGIDRKLPRSTVFLLPMADGLARTQRRRQACRPRRCILGRQQRREHDNAATYTGRAKLVTLGDSRYAETPRLYRRQRMRDRHGAEAVRISLDDGQ
jgi:hypothetical protein